MEAVGAPWATYRIAPQRHPPSTVMMLHQLDSVPEWVEHEDAVDTFQRLVTMGFDASLRTRPNQRRETANDECRMSLPSRAKLGIDAEMKATSPGLQPQSTAGLQRRGFRLLDHAEHVTIEGSRDVLLASRHRELDVIERHDLSGHSSSCFDSSVIPDAVIFQPIVRRASIMCHATARRQR